MNVWRWPVAIGLSTAAGLLLGLLGDGWEDWLACALLLPPVLILCWSGSRMLPGSRDS